LNCDSSRFRPKFIVKSAAAGIQEDRILEAMRYVYGWHFYYETRKDQVIIGMTDLTGMHQAVRRMGGRRDL
jgi:hypothetical protein